MLNPLNKSRVERNIMVLTKPDTITKFNSISPNQSFACMYPFRYSQSNKQGSRVLINYLEVSGEDFPCIQI